MSGRRMEALLHLQAVSRGMKERQLTEGRNPKTCGAGCMNALLPKQKALVGGTGCIAIYLYWS
ncbi:hypothetical protein D3C78_1698130 [compost metagenome]